MGSLAFELQKVTLMGQGWEEEHRVKLSVAAEILSSSGIHDSVFEFGTSTS